MANVDPNLTQGSIAISQVIVKLEYVRTDFVARNPPLIINAMVINALTHLNADLNPARTVYVVPTHLISNAMGKHVYRDPNVSLEIVCLRHAKLNHTTVKYVNPMIIA